MAPRNYSPISDWLSVSKNGNQFTKPHGHAGSGAALISPLVLSSVLGLGLASNKEHPWIPHSNGLCCEPGQMPSGSPP